MQGQARSGVEDAIRAEAPRVENRGGEACDISFERHTAIERVDVALGPTLVKVTEAYARSMVQEAAQRAWFLRVLFKH